MKIDGKELARTIYEDLRERIIVLKKKGITPNVVVFLIGADPSSVAYVSQKEKFTNEIGGEITIEKYPEEVESRELERKIVAYNDDPEIHGIIVQLPVPNHLDGKLLTSLVAAEKDIDGFRPDSAFNPPIAEAVEVILQDVHKKTVPEVAFLPWPDTYKVAIIGKGETGGKPIADYFTKLGIPYAVIDSKTENPNDVLKKADVIVSAVGKPHILTGDKIKKGAVLICIGMYRGTDSKLHGDYEEADVIGIAGYYTPVPGGIGPVNVAMLLKNLVKAAETSIVS